MWLDSCGSPNLFSSALISSEYRPGQERSSTRFQNLAAKYATFGARRTSPEQVVAAVNPVVWAARGRGDGGEKKASYSDEQGRLDPFASRA
ncbi:uncharacterized protein UV8b_04991 [Ustilaginoidea virens]|uniref:Uncharacterized protein n=1 Tax=Ustilaginoidea virens TaxID=1159556 RepID=A0A8E5HSC8_USTVR|nr:uncharacterized protein UV8b_04991 [Ustilaginoidea virens]QUC20750.1 hypothetical protein UV8b_04991 [Ustilaginoidea virens]